MLYKYMNTWIVSSSFHSLSHVQLFVTPWIAACQVSLSITNSQMQPNPCPLIWWCHPMISSSVVAFSSHPQSLPASGSFPMSQLFSWGGQSIRVSASASVLPMNITTNNWSFWVVVLEKTRSPLDCKEIKPVNPKGNQPWIFIGRTDAEAETLILWPLDAKRQLTTKDPDAGKDWGQEENGGAEGKMVR